MRRGVGITGLDFPDFGNLQVDPNDLEIDGWDISGLDLASAMDRARVLEPDLKRQLEPMMRHMKPRKSIFDGSLHFSY